MKILMFGWEFPPYNSGGLGTACYGLTKGLSRQGAELTFVLPAYPSGSKPDFIRLISASVDFIEVKSPIAGYMTPESYLYRVEKGSVPKGLYGSNLFEEVDRFARKAGPIAKKANHDIIHAHDWMTYPAGMAAKKVSGKPLVVHVHATEFDRTSESPNGYVYDIEKKGMEAADAVIAVSGFTKEKIIRHYGIPEGKIHVVHNSLDFSYRDMLEKNYKAKKGKVVLFLGRITLQKGPEYFLYAAKRCLSLDPEIMFVMAGSGDMEPFMIEKSAELGVSGNFLFTGFLRGEDVEKIYQMADVFVMPSVSEPFGLTALEAMKNKTPIIISKQSGVSEIIKNCLLVDFWDIDAMANKILALLRYHPLRCHMSEESFKEIRSFSWDSPARKCMEIYSRLYDSFRSDATMEAA
ncbi:glycosyltransferase family 4 protein [Candidatus Woesearchaeota archaeon]|nr:glycosyltransferase family 4 protein [Candidatus Woesearchaeota archaeon]